MFAAIFAARALDHSPSSGITILYMLPVVLVAVELGRRAGIIASLLAMALFCAWAPFAAIDIPLSAYLSRGLVFVLVGGVAGHLADRMHAALTTAQAGARHFELTRDMLCTANFDGHFIHLNGAWEDCLGWSREELMARPFIELVHPDDRERTEAEARTAIAGGFTANFTNRYRTKDGRWRWIEWSSQLDAERQTIQAVARDVTERLHVEAARREAEERFRRAFDDSATGMAVVGVDGERGDVVLDANETFSRIFGRPRDVLIGSRALTELIDPGHAPAVARGVERLLRGEDAVQRCEYRAMRPDGTRIWLHLTASLVRDEAAHPLYRLVQVLDVTERKRTEERLRYLADHDPLSGVFNRRRFEQELSRELGTGAHSRRRSVVLLLDVDDFKAINDTLGHATGDAVIARLGDALRQRLRSGDVVARLGGDEFAAILRRVDLDAAFEIARGVQALATDSLAEVVGPDHPPITISVGLASLGGATDALTPDELLVRADRALYAAKADGKNRVVVAGDGEGTGPHPPLDFTHLEADIPPVLPVARAENA